MLERADCNEENVMNLAVMGAVVLFGVLADQFFKNRAPRKSVRPPK